jgi:hypothetical protein
MRASGRAANRDVVRSCQARSCRILLLAGDGTSEIRRYGVRGRALADAEIYSQCCRRGINNTQRVLDAEFGKLEKGLLPSLAADDAFLEHLTTWLRSAPPRGRWMIPGTLSRIRLSHQCRLKLATVVSA